jgi:hypothetical protein
MKSELFTRIGIIFLIGLVGWVRSYFLHLNCDVNAPYAIHVPAIIAYFFGSFRKDHIIHTAGAITQLTIYSTIPLMSLFVLKKISSDQLKLGLGYSLSISMALLLVYMIRTNGRGK